VVAGCDNVRSKGILIFREPHVFPIRKQAPIGSYSMLYTCFRAFGMTCGVQQKPNSLVSKHHEREAKKNTTLRAPNRTFCFSRRLFVCCLPEWLCQSAGGVAHSSFTMRADKIIHLPRRQTMPQIERAFNFHKNSSCAGGVPPHFADWQSTNSCCCLVRGHLSPWDEI
jgi:hypothetical protein